MQSEKVQKYKWTEIKNTFDGTELNLTDTKYFLNLTVNELKDEKNNYESNWTELNWEKMVREWTELSWTESKILDPPRATPSTIVTKVYQRVLGCFVEAEKF